MSIDTKERALAARAEGDEAPIKEFQSLAGSAWRKGFKIASDAAHAWLQHVRVVTGQPWLGTAVELPLQHGRSAIIDARSRRTLMQFGPQQSFTIRHGSLALKPEQFEHVRLQVAAAARPPVAEQLLADARFLTGEAPTRDHQRAVLSAAAACEIKAKQSIRSATTPGARPLMEIVLRRTSNLSELLDQIMLASVGRSLKTEDLDLFKRVQSGSGDGEACEEGLVGQGPPLPAGDFSIPVNSPLAAQQVTDPHHDYPAWDLIMDAGAAVYAVRAGRVDRVTNNPLNCADWSDRGTECQTCGIGLTVVDADNNRWIYCHGQGRTVGLGDVVAAGEHILTLGDSGRSGTAHLHLELKTPEGEQRCLGPLLAALYERRSAVPAPASLPTSGCTF